MTEAVALDSAAQNACIDHSDECVSMFCRSCSRKICNHCLTAVHKTHDFVLLKLHRQEIEQHFHEGIRTIEEIQAKCTELRTANRKVLKALTAHLSAEKLRESVNRKFNMSIRELVETSNKLLKQIDFIESVDGGAIWDNISSTLGTCCSLLGKEDAADQYCYQTQAVTKLKDAVSDEGVLTCIDNLEVKFVPTPEISLGHIEEATGWRLVKKIDLPKDKVGMMNTCTALSGRRVAVGYYNGGVDIIGNDDEQRVRILDDTNMYYLTEIGNDVLAVCNTSSKLFTYNISSASDKTSSFITKQTSKHKCLCTDTHSNIFMGYAEFKTIEVFDQSGGSPIRTIKTELDPWCISVMKTGHIAVSQSTSGINDVVHVIKQDGTVVCRIPGCDNHDPYSTCDQLGNIYVAMKHKESGKVNIKKYSSQGDFLEMITSGLQTTTEPRIWIHISCVSPTELIVCDMASVYVFQRCPSLTELMKLMM